MGAFTYLVGAAIGFTLDVGFDVDIPALYWIIGHVGGVWTANALNEKRPRSV